VFLHKLNHGNVADRQDDLGDRLVAGGVRLFSQYGTTETGALLTSARSDYDNDKAWNWLRAEGLIADYLELIPQGSDTFEVVVKDGWPAKILSNRDDGAYCTKDLMQRHPTNKTWFKYIGRLDDTLTQTLGEKTNPVPIELAIVGARDDRDMALLTVARQLAARTGVHRIRRRETSSRRADSPFGSGQGALAEQGGVHQNHLARHRRCQLASTHAL